ncbi:MAG: YraN family protein [Spirochaetales bacterium]|jgi:putative endonuclease|nr:YraN family protein [Spirochaetales bacterium]
MMTTFEKGRQGEEEALAFFQEEGYTALERNYRRPRGEIDLIVRRGDEIIFAEVKRWASLSAGDLEQGIPRRKMRRIMETSKFYLMEHPEFDGFSIRYDVLFVPGTGRKVHHIQDAFREEG